jgi:hypothetical protein
MYVELQCLGLRNSWLKLETWGELNRENWDLRRTYLLKWLKQNRKMSTCNQLDLKSLGSQPTIYAQNISGQESGIKRITTLMDRHIFVMSSQIAGPLCLQVLCQFDHHGKPRHTRGSSWGSTNSAGADPHGAWVGHPSAHQGDIVRKAPGWLDAERELWGGPHRPG